METLITTMLLSMGLTVILSTSVICHSLRREVARVHRVAGRVIRCPQCLGFWVGLAVGLVTISLATAPVILWVAGITFGTALLAPLGNPNRIWLMEATEDAKHS